MKVLFTIHCGLIMVYFNPLIQSKGDNFTGYIEYEVTSTFKEAPLYTYKVTYSDTFMLKHPPLGREGLGVVYYNFESLSQFKISENAKTVEELEIIKEEPAARPRVTETDEFQDIHGYKCRKYIVKQYKEDWKRDVTKFHWVSEELPYEHLIKLAFFTGNLNTMSQTFRNSDGIPLLIETLDKNEEKVVSWELAKKVVAQEPSEIKFDLSIYR